jgi:hypothetical protein
MGTRGPVADAPSPTSHRSAVTEHPTLFPDVDLDPRSGGSIRQVGADLLAGSTRDLSTALSGSALPLTTATARGVAAPVRRAHRVDLHRVECPGPHDLPSTAAGSLGPGEGGPIKTATGWPGRGVGARRASRSRLHGVPSMPAREVMTRGRRAHQGPIPAKKPMFHEKRGPTALPALQGGSWHGGER